MKNKFFILLSVFFFISCSQFNNQNNDYKEQIELIKNIVVNPSKIDFYCTEYGFVTGYHLTDKLEDSLYIIKYFSGLLPEEINIIRINEDWSTISLLNIDDYCLFITIDNGQGIELLFVFVEKNDKWYFDDIIQLNI